MFSTAFLDIPPLIGVGGTVVLPGSKSISNRLLLLAALSSGSTTLIDLLDYPAVQRPAFLAVWAGFSSRIRAQLDSFTLADIAAMARGQQDWPDTVP